MLQFKGFSKWYGDQLIIKTPDMTLDKGLHWLKGENGSGKSTLIKSIAGLLPFTGDVSINGTNIRQDRIAYRQLVNYAEAEPFFPAFLTGTDLVDFYLKTKGGSLHSVAGLMDSLGVNSFVGHKTGTYSSGMAKKLSLVLAFIGSPAWILLDEPLITLDYQSVAVLQQAVSDTLRAGTSFLLTSHQEIMLDGQAYGKLVIHDKTLVTV